MSKKIMFSDRYGLTEAAIVGTKPMTRRIATYEDIKYPNIGWALEGKDKGKRVLCKGVQIAAMSDYAKGEVVAIAQSYKDAGYTNEWVEQHIKPNPKANPTDQFEKRYPGWNNKMFVKADLMPHSIRITDIKVERLQDISDADCLKEGVFQWGDPFHEDRVEDFGFFGATRHYKTAKSAFAALIDKVSGRGTWDSNPWVFVYTFELVK